MLHGNKAMQALRALPPVNHTTPLLASHQHCVQTQAQSFFLVGQVFASMRAANQAEQAFQRCAELSSLAGSQGSPYNESTRCDVHHVSGYDVFD